MPELGFIATPNVLLLFTAKVAPFIAAIFVQKFLENRIAD